jgi:hypothetical protein
MPIKIQLNLPPGDPNGNFLSAGRTVRIHSVGALGGTGVKSSGSQYTSQQNGIIELSSDWRGHHITDIYVYDERGKTIYTLKNKVYITQNTNDLVKVELKKS